MQAMIAVATAIVGVAIVALIVSSKSNTVGVIQNAGSAFTNALGVAVSPVTGSSFTPTASYASYSGSGMNIG